ncbi:DUF3486 family protein [Methylocystis heyeri]|uniref:DUF3486 family protein n=1 Tax=Methylocystis heyeri TaxID=391905 RepID=A0A6B8KE51_9HYPH|nr:DUF3486 family protein [Methylocystis heyeri]QGM46724.1 DUF3486 family protein [Methylocystis heyeri]
MAEGRGRLSSIDLLPEEARDDIVWAMAQLNERSRTQEEIRCELNEMLEAKGLPGISKSAFNRKAVRVASAARRLAESRALFEGLAPQFTPERVDQTNLVIGELIKVLITEMLDSDGKDFSPKGAMELSRAYLATIQGQKLSTERRSKAVEAFKEEAGKAVDKVAAKTGLSAETRERLKAELLGIQRKP